MGYEFDFAAIAAHWALLARGAALTLALAAVAAVAGLAVALACAVARLWGPRPLQLAVATYVELIRNTPFIVQLFFIFFGLPALGLRLSALTAATLAVVVNLSAYAAEILRAGVQSVHAGQRDAGLALGLTPVRVFRLVILPQALAAVWPALVSQIVITMLESAVVSQIAVTDLAHAADYIQSLNYRAFETYITAALIYLALALLLRRGLNLAGRRLFLGRG